ncbi:MAG: recombinase family protein [Acutalibacteraceae bacterium]
MQQYGIINNTYSAAIYCRFSKDDGRAEDSCSIHTQKMMLEKYCMEQGYPIYEVYADDGYSGLNYERPDFQRLLNDIDSGKVNLVITKDLCRLGQGLHPDRLLHRYLLSAGKRCGTSPSTTMWTHKRQTTTLRRSRTSSTICIPVTSPAR